MTSKAVRARIVVAGLAFAAVAAGVYLVLFDRSRAPGPASGAIALKPDDPAVVARGRLVYREHCATCHGIALEGQPGWRTRRADGRLPAPPHDETGHTWHHPDAQLFALTKRGPAALVGGGYPSDMPAYEDTLPDADIIAVLSYIKSRWPTWVRDRHDQINARVR